MLAKESERGEIEVAVAARNDNGIKHYNTKNRPFTAAMNVLNKLIGLSATRASRVFDYTQLDFGDEATLSIFNDYSLGGVGTVEELLGRTLIEVTESKQEISLMFDGNVSLKVSLSDNAYHGPEAMTLHQDDGPIYVWN